MNPLSSSKPTIRSTGRRNTPKSSSSSIASPMIRGLLLTPSPTASRTTPDRLPTSLLVKLNRRESTSFLPPPGPEVDGVAEESSGNFVRNICSGDKNQNIRSTCTRSEGRGHPGGPSSKALSSRGRIRCCFLQLAFSRECTMTNQPR